MGWFCFSQNLLISRVISWLRLIYHRTQIEILYQELWELEKLMYNEESDRGKRND